MADVARQSEIQFAYDVTLDEIRRRPAAVPGLPPWRRLSGVPKQPPLQRALAVPAEQQGHRGLFAVPTCGHLWDTDTRRRRRGRRPDAA